MKQVNMSYILGLMEADGGILLMFGTGKSKRTLKPWVRITQKTNTNLLSLIKAFFDNNDIESSYECWNSQMSKQRAPNLTITKVDSVRKFIELVKQEPMQFLSQKQRDFFILDRVLNSPEILNIKDKVNLKLSMHKADMSAPDVNLKGKKTCEQLEEQFEIPLGQSREDALGILKKIDQQYADHTNKYQQLIANNKLTLPAEWLAGLIDGDGSYYVTIQVREPSKRSKKRFLEIQANFTITMETNALPTLQAIKCIVGSKAPIKKSKAHYQLWIRNQSEVKNLLKLQQSYLPVGNHRLAQYNLIQKIHDYKQNQRMNELNIVLEIIREAYALSSQSKGRERTKTLPEMEAIAQEIYG